MRMTFVVKSNRLPRAPAAMRRAAGAAFAAAKGPLLAEMKRRTPIDTGELRESETAESTDTSLTLRASAGHAIYVHQGTRRMQGRPFMRDTAEQSGPVLTKALQDAASNAL